MIFLNDYKKINTVFKYDFEEIKKIIESKLLNTNLYPISYFNDSIVVYESKSKSLKLVPYDVEIENDKVFLTLSEAEDLKVDDTELREEKIDNFLNETIRNRNVPQHQKTKIDDEEFTDEEIAAYAEEHKISDEQAVEEIASIKQREKGVVGKTKSAIRRNVTGNAPRRFEDVEKKFKNEISSILLEKKIFHDNLIMKLANHYTNHMEKVIDFSYIKSIINEDKTIKQKIKSLPKEVFEKVNLDFNNNYIYEEVPYNLNLSKKNKILIKGTKSKNTLEESSLCSQEMVKITKDLQNFFENYTSKEYLKKFNSFRKNVQKLEEAKTKEEKVELNKKIEKFLKENKEILFLTEGVLDDTINTILLKLRVRKDIVSIKENVLKTLKNSKLFEDVVNKYRKTFSLMEDEDQEKLIAQATKEKEEEKDSNLSNEDVEKNIKTLNKKYVQILKEIFEKIAEYVDEDTPTYEYIQNVLNFAENLSTGEMDIDPQALKNMLIVLTGNVEPHPAVQDEYEIPEDEEEKEEGTEEEQKTEIEPEEDFEDNRLKDKLGQ